MRQDAFFYADQKHMAELQPLCRVQSCQLYRILLGLILVEHGKQCDCLCQFGQFFFFLIALLCYPFDKITDIGPLGLSLARVERIEQPRLIANRLDQIVEHRSGRFAIGAFLEAIDELAKLAHRR